VNRPTDTSDPGTVEPSTADPGATDAVVIERTLDAPIDLVWRMWTDGHEFASWYGPTGASIPVAELDAHVGGQRRVCMEITTPDGPMRMWFGGEHRTVEAPTLLVYSEQITDEDGTPTPGGHATEVRVELSDLDGRTRMVLTHHGIPNDSPGATGWTMAFDKLATTLASDR
jgi:uncharacterized protein YndB with AHSA1/START domain